jgi:hypothetical protein
MDPLTIGTFTIAAVVIFETAGNGVIMTAEEMSSTSVPAETAWRTHGGIRLT